MNRIKEVRKEKGMMQKELSTLANVSQPYLYDLENNHRGAKPETYERIAQVLGVTVNDLMIEEKVG